MASPQIENGHTDIANEIVDAMCKVNLSAYESRVIWFILRKTYGFHKVVDRISYSQFEQGTGLKRWHIARTIERLESRNIITKAGDGHDITYSFQKDYELWKSLPNEVMKSLPEEVIPADEKSLPIQVASLPIQVASLPNEVMKSLPIQVNTKENKTKTKEKTKDIYCENKPLLEEIIKLSGWGSSQLANDVEWLSEFLGEFPQCKESHVRACRDYHSGKKHHTKSQWKSRMRNWMKNDRRFDQQGGLNGTGKPIRGTQKEVYPPGHPKYNGGAGA